MGETTAAGARCPRCSAAVRPGAPWCTQCYAPVGTSAQQRPASGPAAAVQVAERPVAPADAPRMEPSSGTWPCSACEQDNDLALAACTGCGTPFLATVREGRPTLVLPVVGDLLALSPVRRVGLAAGAVVAFVVLTAVLALLLA